MPGEARRGQASIRIAQCTAKRWRKMLRKIAAVQEQDPDRRLPFPSHRAYLKGRQHKPAEPTARSSPKCPAGQPRPLAAELDVQRCTPTSSACPKCSTVGEANFLKTAPALHMRTSSKVLAAAVCWMKCGTAGAALFTHIWGSGARVSALLFMRGSVSTSPLPQQAAALSPLLYTAPIVPRFFQQVAAALSDDPPFLPPHSKAFGRVPRQLWGPDGRVVLFTEATDCRFFWIASGKYTVCRARASSKNVNNTAAMC